MRCGGELGRCVGARILCGGSRVARRGCAAGKIFRCALRGGTAFVWRNARCPARVRAAGYFEVRLAWGRGFCVAEPALPGAGARGGANKPCIAPETSPARSLSKGQRKRAALSGSFFATIPNMRFPFILGAVYLLAVGCAPSLQKHQNQLFARFVAQAHVGCSADEECTAVLLSCRYPQWGYAAINRLELEDVKRIRQADWYTRCKKEPPPADEIPTRCVAGRCRLVNP